MTVEILREIRDELSRLRGDTNARLEELRADTNARFGETNQRLDFLTSGQVRLATEVATLRGVVERNGERFEHFLATEGDLIRDLKTRMTRVERHLGLGE